MNHLREAEPSALGALIKFLSERIEKVAVVVPEELAEEKARYRMAFQAGRSSVLADLQTALEQHK